MSEQERQQDEKTPEEREETVEDLDVPEGDAKDVKGGGDWIKATLDG